MRDKFSELISKGVAKFEYEPIAQSIPEQDPVCRMYNNIFSIPSDTHMSCLKDGTRVITGHMINTDKWRSFMVSCHWGAVNFRTAGYWSLYDFLYKMGLKAKIGVLNNDTVCFVLPQEEKIKDLKTPKSYTTTESKIPQPIHQLTTDGRIEHIIECFQQEDIVKALNESLYVKGCSWISGDDCIMGLVDNKVVVI